MNTYPVKPYKDETAGAIMTDEFISVTSDWTADQAIQHVRQFGKNMNNIRYVYIVDDIQQLRGVLSLRELITSPKGEKISHVMQTDVLTVQEEMDQEEVAKVMDEFDYVSLPVTNHKNELVGVVQIEDILDVVQDETTEDFHKMAPIVDLGENLKDASVSLLYRKRISWLVVLVFVNIFSGAGIAFYEETIEAYVALVFFLPLLVDSGGNAGSQSATLMIRAVALGDVRIKDWFKLFRKEFLVAVLLGVTMGIAVSVMGVVRGGIDVAVVVSVTMILIVMVGSLIGMSLPFVLKLFKMDPATASAPLITSLCDIAGVLIYFSMATWYLGI